LILEYQVGAVPSALTWANLVDGVSHSFPCLISAFLDHRNTSNRLNVSIKKKLNIVDQNFNRIYTSSLDELDLWSMGPTERTPFSTFEIFEFDS
jgi:hypothetical protein